MKKIACVVLNCYNHRPKRYIADVVDPCGKRLIVFSRFPLIINEFYFVQYSFLWDCYIVKREKKYVRR